MQSATNFNRPPVPEPPSNGKEDPKTPEPSVGEQDPKAEEVGKILVELGEILPRIQILTSKLEAAKKTSLREELTEEEKAFRSARIQREKDQAEARGSHPENVERLGAVVGKQFDDKHFERQINESPQAKELAELKERQARLNARLQELTS